MTQICQIFIKVQVPQNEFKIAKFKNPDIDNQCQVLMVDMSPCTAPENALFSFLISQYFISFLFEHPV